MSTEIRYDIVDMDLLRHEYVVRMRVFGDIMGGLKLTLPSWIPGSYMIRDFARNITAIDAFDASGPLRLEKLDKQTWRADDWSGDLTIEYRVYAFDLSVRSAYLDDSRAFFNGTSLFLRPHLDVARFTVSIVPPSGPAAESWQVFTTLPAEAVDAAGFGRYAVEDYALLIDHPVEIGRPAIGEFAVQGVPHRLAVSDGGKFHLARICRDLSEICAEHAAMFGELPIDRYLFLVLATDDGYGGLEHRDSTSLICKRSDLPAESLEVADKGYRRFLGLCSHEYFHLWNVKRIQPERLQKTDLLTETHTELLWAFEGITSYYDDLALPRSGVVGPRDYLEALAEVVTRVQRAAGRRRQSIAESSFDAWTRFYKQDENAPNAIVSYYTKGALVAFGLDVTLRERSADRLCLDDLMRHLWQRFGGSGQGVPERAIEREVAELLGKPLDDFFAAYVYGTEELPLAEWFAAVGIGFRLRPATGPDDSGGYREDERPPKSPSAVLGGRVEPGPEGLRLALVLADGAAQAAGLSVGDLLLAIDGERLTAGNWQDLLQRAAGDSVELHYFRRGRLRKGRLPVRTPPADTCDLWLLEADDLDRMIRQRRDGWLGSRRKPGA